MASVYEVCDDACGDFAGVEGFAELTVGAAFAGGVVADGVHLEKEG